MPTPSEHQGSTIRPRTVWTIYAKEIRETFRDRKTLFLIVGIPLVFYPLLLLVATEVTLSQVDKLQQQVVRVAPDGDPIPERLFRLLDSDDSIEVAIASDPHEALVERQIQAIVRVEEGFSASLDGGDTATITVEYSSVRPLSQQASERLDTHLDTYRKEMVTARLKKRDLTDAWIKPIAVAQNDIAPQERRVGSMLAQFLPMIILVFMVTGAFYPAIDLTAGEKERKTIQTLLTSPVRPLEIVTGKYLVVFTMAMFAGMINLLSMGLVLFQSVSMGAAEALELNLNISGADVAALMVVVVLFGLMLSAVLMTIASMASSPKDAQTYMSPVYMLCLLPVMLAGIPGVDLNQTTACVPVLNLALAMKEILIEGAQVESLFLVGLSTLLVTALALLITARIYNRQELLIQPSTARGLFELVRSPQGGGSPQTPPIDSALA
ncbi:MAG: ABC transporter permease, partial [Myxococcota bacterium]